MFIAAFILVCVGGIVGFVSPTVWGQRVAAGFFLLALILFCIGGRAGWASIGGRTDRSIVSHDATKSQLSTPLNATWVFTSSVTKID